MFHGEHIFVECMKKVNSLWVLKDQIRKKRTVLKAVLLAASVMIFIFT